MRKKGEIGRQGEWIQTQRGVGEVPCHQNFGLIEVAPRQQSTFAHQDMEIFDTSGNPQTA